MRSIEPTPKDLLFSKNDPEDPRLGDLAKVLSKTDQAAAQANSFCILGYPDDEGIKLNKGRPGAAYAPHQIRKQFYKFTPDIVNPTYPLLYDLGNISTSGLSLSERHELGRKLCRESLRSGHRWIGLGGGHDYGYCEATAFLESYPNQKKVIINFDAHMDVRPYDQGFSSGTPFRRMIDEFKSEDFLFLEVGIQSFCNSKAHIDWALSHPQTQILFMDDIRLKGLQKQLEDSLQSYAEAPTLISVDIDAFSSSEAMGCSQSWPTGLSSTDFFSALAPLIGHLDVRALGIYEVSPPLDQDDRTSKLAAQIMEHFIRYQLRKDSLK